MAGVFGVAAGVSMLTSTKPAMRRLALVSSLLAGVGLAMDFHTYSTELHSPGNDYAWELKGPFVAALVVVALASFVRPRVAAR